MTPSVPSLFQFRHGDHLCVFYRSEDALMEVLSPFIAEGLRKGERCFCVQRPEIFQRLEYDLRFIGVDVDSARKIGALEFHSADHVYLPGGRFEPAIMIDMLLRSIEGSLKRGFSGFRSAGDLSWAVEGRNECSQLLGYEALVEECFPGKPAAGMCQYPIKSFPPEILKSVLGLHRQRIVEPGHTCSHASLSVSGNHCITEIIADKFVIHPKYYYVVEQCGRGNVLGWGTAPDFNAATLQAESLVRQLSARKYPN
ncbi:MAG TPA: MEDS domain-containing protein [Candidatus Acidoferrales bacterium]|nr:MEDS domain-containing protein [Candidatus Acidoferrales bacterium]